MNKILLLISVGFFLTTMTLFSFPVQINEEATTITFDIPKDVKIKDVKMWGKCYRFSTFWEQLNNGLKKHSICKNFNLTSPKNLPDSSFDWDNSRPEDEFLLKKGEKVNSFIIPPLNVSFSNSNHGTFCVGFKVRFNEENHGYFLYHYPAEFESIINFCSSNDTKVTDWVNTKPVSNRHNFKEYSEVLSQPVKIKFKQQNELVGKMICKEAAGSETSLTIQFSSDNIKGKTEATLNLPANNGDQSKKISGGCGHMELEAGNYGESSENLQCQVDYENGIERYYVKLFRDTEDKKDQATVTIWDIQKSKYVILYEMPCKYQK